jgi:GNAT superfamily N-acetyltransferase
MGDASASGLHRELLGGLERLNATTEVLQRARRADPFRGLWEGSDVQWWWGRPRVTNELALPVWFDDDGPVGAVGLTASGDRWQTDVFAVPSKMSEADVWAATMDAAAQHWGGPLEMLVRGGDSSLVELALESGFTMTDEPSGTSWMEAEQCPSLTHVEGFEVIDRTMRLDIPHQMIARNGEQIEERLRQCSLYDPELDLCVVTGDGEVAGYALFWFDPTTLVGLLEPMRVLDDFQRRGIARMLLGHGLHRLVHKGAVRLKVGYQSEAARDLYLGSGFVPTSDDRRLIRD